MVLINRTSTGQIKVEKEILKEMQVIFKPIFKNKKATIKQVIDYILTEYDNELEIIKKDTISIRIEPELF